MHAAAISQFSVLRPVLSSSVRWGNKGWSSLIVAYEGNFHFYKNRKLEKKKGYKIYRNYFSLSLLSRKVPFFLWSSLAFFWEMIFFSTAFEKCGAINCRRKEQDIRDWWTRPEIRVYLNWTSYLVPVLLAKLLFYHILCLCVYLDLVAIKCRNTLKTMLKNIKSICRSLNIRINYLSLTIILDITKD